MNVLVDTSAFLAFLDADDANHAQAKALWERTVGAGTTIVCHNYILVETSAVILRRLGLEAVRVFEQDVVPVLGLIWVAREVHEAAVSAHLLAARRTLSLVDCVSFEIMRRTGIRSAFAFDRHFAEYGYELLAAGR
jgi:predicted nucleic acid-binding protein